MEQRVNIINDKGRGTIIKFVYICYMISLLIGGFPLILGFIVNIFMRGDANKIELSHFKYQTSLFLKGFIWGVIGIITIPIVIGIPILLGLFIWFVIRCVKGLDLISRGLPIDEYYR